MAKLKGKSLIFTDLHFGRKNFSYEKTQDTLNFMKKEILGHEDINNIFMLGDIWDHRKIIDWSIFNLVNEFFEELEILKKNIIIVIGNHDIYHKNRIDENSLKYLEKMFKNISIVHETHFVKFNDKDLLFVPWLVDEEDKNNPTESQIKSADMILGHFEFIGFNLLPGIEATHGFNVNKYENKKVLSGHYHVSSEKNQIKYLGVCQQITWSDFNTKKGYHILNEDLTLTFIENNISERYIKLLFNKDNIILQGLEIGVNKKYNNIKEILSEVNLQSHNIRVQVNDKSNKKEYNNFIIGLDMNHIEYHLVDNTPEMNDLININQVDEDDISVADMIINMINQEDKKLFTEIYNEAIQMEDI